MTTMTAMTTEQRLDRLSEFFNMQQSHYQANAGFATGVDSESVDLAAREAAAQEEMEERGEGDYPFTSDVADVLYELEARVDEAAEGGLDYVGDQTPEQVMADVKDTINELQDLVKLAMFWGSGQDEETRFTFEIYTQDKCSFDLELGYD